MPRHISTALGLLVLSCNLAVSSGIVWAQAPPGTDRVEEDWELVVSEPSTLEVGPQVTTIMAPEPDPARTLMIVNLNFREEPYGQGGFQTVCWYDEVLVADKSSETDTPLNHDNETIRWTQRLSVANNVLSFDVVNGTSQSWGSFGQGASLKLNVTTHVDSLATYDSNFSVKNSVVGWQANRVQHLKLLRVRYFEGDTLLGEEITSRTVDLKW